MMAFVSPPNLDLPNVSLKREGHHLLVYTWQDIVFTRVANGYHSRHTGALEYAT